MGIATEAERPVDTALGHTDGDKDVGDVKHGRAAWRLWVTRWTEPAWNYALLRAATVAGVHRIWRSGRTHGRLNQVKETMVLAFAKESSSMSNTGEDPLHSRSMWKRLETMVQQSILAEDYKKDMTCTEWEAFLKSKALRKGDPGYKKWAALQEYCIIQGWLPAGEDDPRYPTDTLEKAQAAQEDLKDLCDAYRLMLELKDEKKVEAVAAADKSNKKDFDGLALER